MFDPCQWLRVKITLEFLDGWQLFNESYNIHLNVTIQNYKHLFSRYALPASTLVILLLVLHVAQCMWAMSLNVPHMICTINVMKLSLSVNRGCPLSCRWPYVPMHATSTVPIFTLIDQMDMQFTIIVIIIIAWIKGWVYNFFYTACMYS